MTEWVVQPREALNGCAKELAWGAGPRPQQGYGAVRARPASSTPGRAAGC